MRLAGVRRTDEIFERARFGRKAFEVEAQAECGIDPLVDALVLELLVGRDEPAPRVFQRAEERRAFEHARLVHVVGFGEDLDGRAFDRGAEGLQRRVDDLGHRGVARGRRHLIRQRYRDAAADHDRARAEREAAFAANFGRRVADQFPAERVGRLAPERAFRFEQGDGIDRGLFGRGVHR